VFCDDAVYKKLLFAHGFSLPTITNHGKMVSAFPVFILAIFIVQLAMGMPTSTCTFGKKPIGSALVGQKASASSCGRGAVGTGLRIEPWAVIFQTGDVGTRFMGSDGFRFQVCVEETSAVYVRGNKTPMLYHRPGKYSLTRNDSADCSQIPARKIMAYGKDRKEFIVKLKNLASEIESMRSTNYEDCWADPNRKISRANLNARLKHYTVTTAALTLIQGMAFNSYICV